MASQGPFELAFLDEQVCVEERVANRDPANNGDAGTSLMVLRNRQGLYEDLKYVISLPDLCDVTFLVGEDRKPVCGVRAILATRSRVFHQLLLAHQHTTRSPVARKSQMKRVVSKLSCIPFKSRTTSDDVIPKLTIPVQGFDPETFDRLMSYVHCGSMTVDPSTVIGLLNAAQEYGFPELRKACWDFAVACVTRTDRLHELFLSARRYKDFKLTRLLMQTMRRYASDYPDVLKHNQTLQELAREMFTFRTDDADGSADDDDYSSTSSWDSSVSSWSGDSFSSASV